MTNANPRVGDPMPPIFHLLALGVAVGGNANYGMRIGGNANFSISVGGTQILAFLDTNMLVSPRQNCGVGGLSQREWFCIAVEYRL